MTDFLHELELQMTAAAHRAAAERARPPRVKRWPTVAFVAVAAVAVVAMVLMPAREREAAPSRTPLVSLKDTTIGLYNAAGVDSIASSAGPAIRKLNRRATVDSVPSTVKYSVVLADRAHAAQARRVARALGIERFGAPRDLGGPRTYDVTVLLGRDFVAPAPQLLRSFAFVRESLNRRIFTVAGPVQVVASRAGLCLQVHDGAGWGGTCADVTDALAGKLVLSSRAQNGRLRAAVGLVPDGVDAVELDGGTRRVPVARNVWAIGPEQVTTVSFGTTTIAVP